MWRSSQQLRPSTSSPLFLHQARPVQPVPLWLGASGVRELRWSPQLLRFLSEGAKIRSKPRHVKSSELRSSKINSNTYFYRWAKNESGELSRTTTEDPSQQHLQFRYDLLSGRTNAIHRYEEYIESTLLDSNDAISLLGELRKSMHNSGPLADGSTESAEKVARLVGHYQSGRLAHSPRATGILLQICSEAGDFDLALELLDWAETRGAAVINSAAYSPLVRQASKSGQGRKVCESLYDRAIYVSSSAFARRLSSPNSVLQYPDQLLRVRGLSSKLLSAIALSRFSDGDWNAAWMTIDTIFQLFPGLVPNDMLHDVNKHRTVEETIRLYHLYCVSGGTGNASLTWRLARRLRGTYKAIPTDDPHASKVAFQVSMALIDLIHTAIATDQSLGVETVQTFLLSLLDNLPRAQDTLSAEHRQLFSELATNLKQTTQGLFGYLGLPDFDSDLVMTRIASETSHEELLLKSLNALVRSRTRLSVNQLHEVMGFVLDPNDPDMVRKAWTQLSAQLEITPESIDLLRLEAYKVRTASWAALIAIFRGHRADGGNLPLEESSSKIEPTDASKTKDGDISSQGRASEVKLQKDRLETLIERLNHLSELVKTSSITNLRAHPPPMISLCPTFCHFPEEWHARLYKEMHLDPLSRSFDLTAEENMPKNLSKGAKGKALPVKDISFQDPAVNRYGLPWLRVRHHSFRRMNDILMFTYLWEKHQALFAQGTRLAGPRLEELVAQDVSEMTEDQWRGQILALRNATDQMHDSSRAVNVAVD